MLSLTDSRPATSEPASSRPTLVMSHSFGFSRREWIEVAGLLAREYRAITIDMPGFGAARDVPGYSMEEMSRQFAEVIRELGLERYVLVGHSMTGKVMSILASRMGRELGLERAPEKLVLLTPTPLSVEVGTEKVRQTLLAMEKHRWDAEKFVATHSGLPLPPDIKERTMQDYLQASHAAWEAWLNSGIHEDWVDRAAPIEIETLVIAAERDPIWGPVMQQKMTMPHLLRGRLVTVDCGHLVPLELPARLAELLRDFVGF